MATTERRTQAERSAGTQGALVDAAIDTLLERGWAATTAVEVCQRAGVSRGALVHHFPDLSGLLAHSLEAVYAALAADRELPTTLLGLVDDAWEITRDRRFKAVLEAWSAMGNDADLAREIAPVMLRFAKLVQPDELLGAGGPVDADARTFAYLAREALLGLALGRSVSGGRALPHEPAVVASLRAQAAALDATRGAAR